MSLTSFITLISRRATGDWILVASVFASMVLATTVGAATPLYLKSLEQLAFTRSLDELPGRYLDFNVFASHVPLTVSALQENEQVMSETVDRHISAVAVGRERLLKGAPYYVGLPWRPLPARRLEPNAVAGRGYFQAFSSLGERSRFVRGRMAVDAVSGGPGAPRLEAVISVQTSQKLGLDVEDLLTLTPSVGANNSITVRIVGVFEPADITDIYWSNARTFLDPEPLTELLPPGITIPPDEPPVPMFVGVGAMVQAVEQAYPGLLVYGNSITSILVDKERLKEWSLSESRSRLGAFEREITRAMPGLSATTGLVRGVVDDVERRGFFSTVPLLLLAAVMTSTILILLSLTVSHLAHSRETDAGRLRSRGVGSLSFLRFYLVEGIVLAVAATALAPPLAAAAVLIAGKLPYFRQVEGGSLLWPVIGPGTFASAAGMGLACLIVFATMGFVSTRGGLLAQRLRTARPPGVSFIHRHYLDVAVMVLGGLVFWELRSRGHVISGGLFEELNVNEALLLAPVLFMIAVGLIFMRVFPLFVRFVSGESAGLVDLAAGVSVAGMLGVLALDAVRGDGVGATVMPAGLTVAIGGLYWATNRARRPAAQWVGLGAQIVAVGALLAVDPPAIGDAHFGPGVALAGLVPAQILFRMLSVAIRSAPVWLSMSLWQVSRNPNAHTWMVLLLVLTTGLGILSTTVGATLERSQVDRVLYKNPSDIRVSGISRFMKGGMQSVKQRHIDTGEVAAASMAFRTTGRMGQAAFTVFGIETAEFMRTSWYRDDFSSLSLQGLMQALQADAIVDRLVLPDGASDIAAWIKPSEGSDSLFLEMVVREGSGEMHTLSLGELGAARWHLVSAEIPSELEPPIELVSVQVFELSIGDIIGAGGPPPTTGTLLVDDVHVNMASNVQTHMLEDFEGLNRWTAIETSVAAEDTIGTVAGDSHGGSRAGIFSYGSYRNSSVRGFYLSEAGGAVPVIASSSFLASTGFRVGDTLIARVAGRLTPAIIRGSADLFPTLDPGAGGFLLADLDVLLGYLNIFDRPNRLQPNELYVRRANGGGALEPLLAELAAKLIRVEDGASRLKAVRQDPFWAGWRAVVVISLGTSVLVALSGYVAYTLLFAFRSRGEIGFLRCIGLSHGQRIGMLALQHLSMVAIGLTLGAWAGRQMSAMMVEPLAVGDNGGAVVPPFLLMTDWLLVAVALGVVVAGFVAVLLALSRRFGRLSLYLIARFGED